MKMLVARVPQFDLAGLAAGMILCAVLLAGCNQRPSEGPHVTNHRPQLPVAAGYANAIERAFAREVAPSLQGRACRVHLVDVVDQRSEHYNHAGLTVYYVVTGLDERVLDGGYCSPHPGIGKCTAYIVKQAKASCGYQSVP